MRKLGHFDTIYSAHDLTVPKITVLERSRSGSLDRAEQPPSPPSGLGNRLLEDTGSRLDITDPVDPEDVVLKRPRDSSASVVVETGDAEGEVERVIEEILSPVEPSEEYACAQFG